MPEIPEGLGCQCEYCQADRYKEVPDYSFDRKDMNRGYEAGNVSLAPRREVNWVPKKREMVNHPAHYNSHPSGVECIEIVRHMTFNVGSAFKYCWRAGLKPGADTIEDLRKAVFYLNDEIKRLENAPDPTDGEQDPWKEPL